MSRITLSLIINSQLWSHAVCRSVSFVVIRVGRLIRVHVVHRSAMRWIRLPSGSDPRWLPQQRCLSLSWCARHVQCHWIGLSLCPIGWDDLEACRHWRCSGLWPPPSLLSDLGPSEYRFLQRRIQWCYVRNCRWSCSCRSLKRWFQQFLLPHWGLGQWPFTRSCAVVILEITSQIYGVCICCERACQQHSSINGGESFQAIRFSRRTLGAAQLQRVVAKEHVGAMAVGVVRIMWIPHMRI